MGSSIPSEYPSLTPTVVHSSEPSLSFAPSLCPRIELDFSELGAGSYVNDQLNVDYGVTISASGEGTSGTTPDGAARVLGTGMSGIGNAIVIQSSSTTLPNWNENGGSITISFAQPVELEHIGVLRTLTVSADLDFSLEYADGTITTPDPHYEEAKDWEFFEQKGIEEVLYRVYLSGKQVKSFTITGSIEFAITDISYVWCPYDSAFPTTAPTTAMPSEAPIFAPTDEPDFVCVDEEFLDEATGSPAFRREF